MSSRKGASRRTRVASDIEDGSQPSQPKSQKRAEPIQDDDEGEPISRPKKGTAKKGQSDDQDEEDDDDSEDEVIDIDNFEDQPWERADIDQLLALAADWGGVGKNIRDASGEMFPAIATALVETEIGDMEEVFLSSYYFHELYLHLLTATPRNRWAYAGGH